MLLSWQSISFNLFIKLKDKWFRIRNHTIRSSKRNRSKSTKSSIMFRFYYDKTVSLTFNFLHETLIRWFISWHLKQFSKSNFLLPSNPFSKHIKVSIIDNISIFVILWFFRTCTKTEFFPTEETIILCFLFCIKFVKIF